MVTVEEMGELVGVEAALVAADKEGLVNDVA